MASETTEFEIVKLINSLKYEKSSGVEKYSNWNGISISLHSNDSDNFLEEMITSTVVSITKKKLSMKIDNVRPITLVPALHTMLIDPTSDTMLTGLPRKLLGL